METLKGFYESFKKAKKFPAGKKAKKKSGLLKGKNNELSVASSGNAKKKVYISGTASAAQPRRRSCCGR